MLEEVATDFVDDLLANARGESDSGLSNTSAMFEKILISGFVLSFWDKLFYPIILLFGIAGFVIYRFRETRAMTLGQFLEMRYSRPFRLYMGALAFLSGILNYGIFPGISARFFIYFLDLPHTLHLGPIAFSTFGVAARKASTCFSVQNPMTRSTPARLFQDRSKMTISPAAGKWPR